jgi:predicted metal-dependent hydrolase
MSTEAHAIVVNGLTVHIVRKPIKNLHLGVYPPHGRVRVAAPVAVSDAAVRLAVIGKLGWVKRQQAKFAAQTREPRHEMVSGESHYVFGRRYRLRVVEHPGGPSRVVQRNRAFFELHVSCGAGTEARRRLLQRWYRDRLREAVQPLLSKWETILGVRARHWGIKRMKTKWGACTVDAHRVWFNLELAKKSERCLEYLVVHELTHLLERHHNERFLALMDRHLPNWRALRELLNSAPLAHEDWTY